MSALTLETVFTAENVEAMNLAQSALADEDDGFLSIANATQIWILIAGFLVFWMHAGFTMLEAGSVRHSSAVNILFKNIGTIAIGAVCYYFLGYGFAYGEGNAEESSYDYISVGSFANKDMPNSKRDFFFFQFAFAATAATIVSGAVAGRVALPGYFLLVVWLTAFVYPVISHNIWGSGFLSAFNGQAPFIDDSCNVIDFAGSGVVHMTGGIAAFWAALVIGPRLGRFDEGGEEGFAPHNVSLQTLGVFILWFGWYGFNCGSTLLFDGGVASKVAVTTTLAPAGAVVTSIIVSRLLKGHYDIGDALNSALAGLVSITAGCPVVDDGTSIGIGAIGCLVYLGADKLLKLIKLDDPVNAIPVHGFAGMWGVLAAGIFATPGDTAAAYGSECAGSGQVVVQLVFIGVLIAFVTALVLPVVIALKFGKILRVSPELEENLDSEHGGASVTFLDDTAKTI